MRWVLRFEEAVEVGEGGRQFRGVHGGATLEAGRGEARSDDVAEDFFAQPCGDRHRREAEERIEQLKQK